MKIISRANLVVSLDFITARTDHVETSHISVLVHELIVDLHILAGEHTTRTVAESVHISTNFLGEIVDSGNHVVTSRSLTSRKHHTDVHRSPNLARALLILYTRKSVSAGEQSLNFLYSYKGFLTKAYHDQQQLPVPHIFSHSRPWSKW